MAKKDLKELLNLHYERFNCEFSQNSPDPILRAKDFANDKNADKIALFCALFAYGNARAILKFLQNYDFFDYPKFSKNKKPYRFQNASEISAFAQVLFSPTFELKLEFLKGFNAEISSELGDIFSGNARILGGIKSAQSALFAALKEKGLNENAALKFLIGEPNSKTSPRKRWNMFLRWAVRSDKVDYGFWRSLNIDSIESSKKSLKFPTARDLILPLDTHTFKNCQKLGLIKRKSYDLKAALEATQSLREICEEDPIKYDFALYRLGQMKIDF